VRDGKPIDTVAATDFAERSQHVGPGRINVTEWGFDNRQVDYDGSGVYVAVLDTGLVQMWRQYFPRSGSGRSTHARSGAAAATWGGSPHSQQVGAGHQLHGTHVTSTILGYSLGAHRSTASRRWRPSSGQGAQPERPRLVVGDCRGIVYVADLKAELLADYPVVIKHEPRRLGLDPMEKAAIDYAISQGVIVVASAGNRGIAGMGYPGGYAPSSPCRFRLHREWYPPAGGSWWWRMDPLDPRTPLSSTSSTSRAASWRPGPGRGRTGSGCRPYQVNSGQTSYYFLGGTSMASPTWPASWR